MPPMHRALCHNRIVSIPPEIGNLSSLQALWVLTIVSFPILIILRRFSRVTTAPAGAELSRTTPSFPSRQNRGILTIFTLCAGFLMPLLDNRLLMLFGRWDVGRHLRRQLFSNRIISIPSSFGRVRNLQRL